MIEFTAGVENLAVSAADRAFVAAALGREPRGLEAIQVRRDSGEPAVIRVSSLVDEKPFPTLFWLVDPGLCYQIDQLEAAGTIARLQAQVDDSPELQQQMAADNRAYIALRQRLMSAAVREQLEKSGYLAALESKGIGGLGNFTRIRCLHTWFAAHLVLPNAVGGMLESGCL